jgi:dolichol-phosphate mannosyltransferase
MSKKYLIAISTYKEEQNIIKLIKKIRKNIGNIKILIINDYSGDNTRDLVEKLKDSHLIYIERPKKLGLGTAHKLSIFYAIKYNFRFLITMDADFSHDPAHLKALVSLSNENNFVIGSRFCKNGKSDYVGIRKLISFYGNFLAKKILNLNINEITTYYRVYSVKLLKKLPFDELNAEGYSLGVRLIWLIKKMHAELIETPIHFRDRSQGKSKIPKFQIFYSLIDLFSIKFKDIFIKQKFYPKKNNTLNFKNQCKICKTNFMSLIKKKKFVCLVCKNFFFKK